MKTRRVVTAVPQVRCCDFFEYMNYIARVFPATLLVAELQWALLLL